MAPATFLALGDSYTIGDGVAADDRWPTQLAHGLRKSGGEITDPRIVAQTGWTCAELLAAIRDERLQGHHDLVTLQIGVNDQYRGHGLDRFRPAFHVVLATALSFAKLPGHLVVLSIPDWSVTPFASGRDRSAVAREIDAFNGVCRSSAIEVGARFVDVTASSREAASDSRLLAADGLHPSAVMYAKWVEQVVPVVRDILTRSK
jgi:lysophospholipase L1-like esterase